MYCWSENFFSGVVHFFGIGKKFYNSRQVTWPDTDS